MFATFDVGGTNVKYAVINELAEILSKGSFPTPKENIDQLVDEMEQIITTMKSTYEIEGIALSCPGAVNNETGFIVGASAVPYIHGPNIREVVEGRTGLKVALENDANCAALAEVWKGAAKEATDSLFVVCGTGIGGAVIKDRKLHVGKNLHGGEFGYMLMKKVDGDFKNWSDVGSTNALITRAAKLKGIEKSQLTGEEVFRLASEGDKDCEQAINDFYETMAIGLFNLQYTYDPDVIVIGGAISAREDLIENVYEKLDEIITNVKIANVRPVVAKCAYGNDANLIGAVYNYLGYYKDL